MSCYRGLLGSRKEKFVERIINLTLSPINVYEDSSGRIFHYDFCKAPVVVFEEAENDKTDLRSKIYVVDQDLLTYFQEWGYPLDDVAIVESKSPGRHGKEISRLSLVTDPDVYVRLRVSSMPTPA